MNVTSYLIGMGAGIVSALLFASASSGTVLGVFILFFLSPLPLAITGLGWGGGAALFGALVGAAIVAALGNIQPTIFYLVAIGAPIAVLTYHLMLHRDVPVPDGTANPVQEWYPIGRVLAIAVFWAGGLATLALLSNGQDIEGLKSTLRAALDRMLEANTPGTPGLGRNLSDQEKTALVGLMVSSLGGVLATLWLTVASINLWLAGHVTRLSGRLARPWPDLAALDLPRWMSVAFALAIAGTFLAGVPGLIATGFAGAILFAYMLVGLAIMHWVTRGMTLRPFMLTVVYLALMFLNPLSGLLIAFIGMAEPISPIKRQTTDDNQSPPNS